MHASGVVGRYTCAFYLGPLSLPELHRVIRGRARGPLGLDRRPTYDTRLAHASVSTFAMDEDRTGI
jgi:hypothetical protein